MRPLVIYGHLADGNLHVNVLGLEPDDERVDLAIAELVAEHCGRISAEHGVGLAKREMLRLVCSSEEIEAMRSVKAALDPTGLLGAGRVLPSR